MTYHVKNLRIHFIAQQRRADDEFHLMAEVIGAGSAPITVEGWGHTIDEALWTLGIDIQKVVRDEGEGEER